jgi:hypothetical protein
MLLKHLDTASRFPAYLVILKTSSSLVYWWRSKLDYPCPLPLNPFQFVITNHPTIPSCTVWDTEKPLKKFWEELIAYFPWIDTGHIENDASNNSSIVACVFVTAVTLLPSRCLATMGYTLSLIRNVPHWKRRVQELFYCCVCIRYRGNVSTEPLPRNDRGIFTAPLPSNDRWDTQTATWSHNLTLLFFSK